MPPNRQGLQHLTSIDPISHLFDLRSFQNGQPYFLWGRDKATGESWKLKDGRGNEDRDLVNDRIICPDEHCPSPRLTTVARSAGRHHLRHFVGSYDGHGGPESFAHSQGCAQVEQWLKARYPRSKVQREERSNDAGERRADVMMTAWKDERRVAVEIQYTPITVAEWEERHASYVRQGITDIWLFGHTGKQMKVTPQGTIKPSLTHLAVMKSGAHLFFLNPFYEGPAGELGIVGAARWWRELKGHRFQADQYTDGDRLLTTQFAEELPPMRLTVDWLHNLGLQVDGLHSPALDRLYEHNAAFDSRVAKAAAIKQKKLDRIEHKREVWKDESTPLVAAIRSQLLIVDTDMFDGQRIVPGTASESGSAEGSERLVELIGEYTRKTVEHFRDANLASTKFPNPFPSLYNFDDYFWWSVIWFNHVSGADGESLSTKKCFATLQRHGSDEAFRDARRRIGDLQKAGYLVEDEYKATYPDFHTTEMARWW